MIGFPSAALVAATHLLGVSFEAGGAQADPATCWQRLRVLQAALDSQSAIAPGHVITRTHRERERALRLCRRGDYEAGIEIIELSIDKLMKHEARDGR